MLTIAAHLVTLCFVLDPVLSAVHSLYIFSAIITTPRLHYSHCTYLETEFQTDELARPRPWPGGAKTESTTSLNPKLYY